MKSLKERQRERKLRKIYIKSDYGNNVTDKQREEIDAIREDADTAKARKLAEKAAKNQTIPPNENPGGNDDKKGKGDNQKWS